ncbi:MAG: hypothetical protein J3Q66DRAFT_82234 [Benniella sp.]|nr:MAG: hypothetical protein J3Q66DRAFT_82234 [Benniella sp.]
MIHYLPFFFMNRQLYLHHYLPSLYFSILLLVSQIDRTWQNWTKKYRYTAGVLLVAWCGALGLRNGFQLVGTVRQSNPWVYGNSSVSGRTCLWHDYRQHHHQRQRLQLSPDQNRRSKSP